MRRVDAAHQRLFAQTVGDHPRCQYPRRGASTSVLVPLSVFMLPNSETLIPAIDKVADRNFGIVLKVVDWQHEIGAPALNHLGSFASN